MPYRVDLVRVFYHPRTGKRLSEDKAKAYNRRAKKKIRAQHWLIARTTVGDTSGLSQAQISALKQRAGRIQYSARLTQTESILKLSSFKDRRVRQTLADKKVFSKLWDDFHVPDDIQRRGSVRISISGTVEGRRVKEIIHLPFLRSVFSESYRNEDNAKEGFKDYLVGAILTNLRRRGLRISNPIESAKRINDLTKNRQGMLNMLELETKDAKKGGWLERIKWASDSIRLQKKSKQLRGATIRVEKLI